MQIILPSGVSRGSASGGEVLNFPTCPTFKYRIRSSQNIVRKISNLVSIAPFQYEGKEKEVVKLLLGQG